MKFFVNPLFEKTLWQLLCVWALIMLLAACVLTVLLIRQKRYRLLSVSVVLIGWTYFLQQCFDMSVSGTIYNENNIQFIGRFVRLDDWLVLLFCLVPAVMETVLFINIHRYEKRSITANSVKEAMDSLPTGIMYYAPGAKLLLVNSVMQNFCQKATGSLLVDGQSFMQKLHEGKLAEGCSRMEIGPDELIMLPEGTVYKISEREVMYEGYPVNMTACSDITEVYHKTEELQQLENKVEKAGEKLQKVNQEIVALTIAQEMMNARIRIHDDFGSNLLSIRNFIINGGSEEQKMEIVENLKKSIAFMVSDTDEENHDEYELLVLTGRQIGVEINITGMQPQNEPVKSIILTAIHECMTNTLRHGHGNRLDVEINGNKDEVTIVLTNNGDVPDKEIKERGGLACLRELVQQAEGSMSICIKPAFSIIIKLPMEDEYGI